MADTDSSMPTHLLRKVSVVGSGTAAHPARAVPLGAGLARLGVHLVTGGGQGVMAEVDRGLVAVTLRRGVPIGVLPAREESSASPEPPVGYPNPWVEIPVRTHLSARGKRGIELESRNHLVVLTDDVAVAMPGGVRRALGGGAGPGLREARDRAPPTKGGATIPRGATPSRLPARPTPPAHSGGRMNSSRPPTPIFKPQVDGQAQMSQPDPRGSTGPGFSLGSTRCCRSCARAVAAGTARSVVAHPRLPHRSARPPLHPPSPQSGAPA